MQQDYEQKYHRIEQEYWWFRGRRDMIARLLKELPPGSRVLDLGCCSGALIRKLRTRYMMHGLDSSPAAVAHCRKTGIRNVKKADAAMTGFADNYFDCIIASDILEHIKDHAEALAEWKRILKPGGLLLVFVPAFQFLWGSHDEANQHFRRYTRPQLAGLIRSRGFRVERCSYWNFAMFFPVLLFRQRKGAGDDLYQLNRAINSLLFSWLKIENSVVKHIDAPVGTSVFAVCTSRP